VWNETKKKYDKPPCSPRTGQAIGPTEKHSDHWTTLAEAIAGAEKFHLGVGRTLIQSEGYVVIDIDGTDGYDATTDEAVLLWPQWFDKAYIERSPSGRGLHIWCRGKIAKNVSDPKPLGKNGAQAEIYSKDRYMTLTGDRLGKTPMEIGTCQTALDKFMAALGQEASSQDNSAGDGEPRETTVESAVAYLEAFCRELESAGDGRQALCTRKCFWLGRVISGNQVLKDPRLGFQVVKDRITEAVRKSPGKKWPTDRYEVIERQLKEGITKPLKIVEDEEIEIRDWPEPPAPEAFLGLVGDFVRLWQDHTEASPVALAAQFLAFFGHAVGRQPFYAVGGDDHHANLQLTLVGPTSFARKGQSYSCVKLTFDKVMLDLGVPYNEARGLSTGEGLINSVRDPRSERNKKGETVIVDDGVIDKRLLVFESEFASVLRRMVKEGNTLSEVMRQAWDSGNLGTMTRNAPLRASGAHISIITHVTPSDLQSYLSDISAMNGFANRIIFVATRRVKSLPDPGRPPEDLLAEFAKRLARVIECGRAVRKMIRSSEASVVWNDLYEKLSAPRTGRQHNATVARAPAHVLRLSMIYALLDESAVIEAKHLASAAALWDYAERTSRFVFGDSLGDKVAEQILEMLRAEPKGMTTREIRAKLYDKKRAPDALRLLHENGQVRQEALKQPGASPFKRGQRWFSV
jgi:hypothetical protein